MGGQEAAELCESVRRHRGCEHTSYWRVYCEADCGFYLAGGAGSWCSTPHQRHAARFPDEDKAWQAAMAAGWANVLLPGHDPHRHGPYGPGRHMFYCNQGGAGDCQEVRFYKEATVCRACRDGGWRP
jgi:hypothetical protein